MTTGTAFPSTASVERYRAEGWWLPATTKTEAWTALTAGGDRTALIDENGEWTYDRLATAVVRIAEDLAASGCTAGDAVLIVAPLRNEAVAAYLAVITSGCTAVLVDRRSGQRDVTHAHTVAHPRVSLAFDEDARRMDLETHGLVLSLDRIGTTTTPSSPTREFPNGAALLDPDAPAAVVFTSGTTGTPKGVIHTINTLRCGAMNMGMALGYRSDDRPFLSTPLASITGVIQITLALSHLSGIVLENRFQPAASLDRLRRTNATIIGGAPIIVESLFGECATAGVTSLPLRSLALGGTQIPASLIDTARKSFGIRAIRVYGSSEVPFSTSTQFDTAHSGADDTDEGLPLRGVEISLRLGGSDELLVRGPHRFHGYLDPHHNIGSFDGDWVRTGDQGGIRDGRLAIKGRLKEVVARKGMKISLMEIDAVAESLSDIGECAAYGVDDPETGERLVLAVHVRDGVTAPDYATVVSALTTAGLATWKLPEEIVIWTDPLPRTESGKIRRPDLVRLGAHRPRVTARRLAST
ncbi:class I adenylate-forming enzyme family protein [Gordonia rhizosphera]|uniref:class I adenylate-forming enzyme family protein n=1 Tax=Gordonia rhizosphera TaxID=83341 RepID=UPI00068DEA8E|nr:class I adenylate-forming enzyme family protein [Gordonia rhizosphera]